MQHEVDDHKRGGTITIERKTGKQKACKQNKQVKIYPNPSSTVARLENVPREQQRAARSRPRTTHRRQGRIGFRRSQQGISIELVSYTEQKVHDRFKRFK
uniref:(northern house mosquito) hypothetical protein n=1 Tax=Culex pipiens TaxID=7175 RepID=A0A8D8EZQ8_CULPI